MNIVVGLGNPGIHYQLSRHNIGFLVVDRLAEIHNIHISIKRFKAIYGKGWVNSEEIIVAKPMTFMNRSGEAVRRMAQFFEIDLGNLIVIHDDLDLPFGRLRFKRRGGDGGHLGVRSIIETMGGDRFLRLKVGLGRPPEGMDPAEYVLSSFDHVETFYLNEILNRAAEALKVYLLEGLEKAMNLFQKRDRKGG